MGKLRRVLLVHPEHDMQEQIQDLLEEALDEELVVHWTPDQKRAESYLKSEGCELIISHTDIPYDRKVVSDKRRQNCGIELLESLRKQQNLTPFMLISGSPGDDFFKIQDYKNVRVVRTGTEMRADIDKYVGGLLSLREAERTVELDITLDPDNHKFFYTLCVRDENSVLETEPETLSVDRSLLEEVIEDSSELPEQMQKGSKVWKKKLHRLGKHLATAIFDRNPELLAKFYGQLDHARLDDARIRFVVEKQVYPAVLEAILEKSTNKYWMLQAPVYRKIKMDGRQYPLFSGPSEKQKNLNCLIIEAQFEGYVGDLEETFAILNNVKSEAQWLEAFLTENKTKFDINEVCRLPRKGDDRPLAQQVQEALMKDTNQAWDGWHLVHYAGHSYYDEEGRAGEKNTGYVLLPDDPSDLVDANTFASWLSHANVRFLYLSSCRSSEEDFALQLASSMIPAVVGFRWDLHDDMAQIYTEKFYEHLFATRSLESAFFKARKDIHDAKPNNPTWASPILIVQVK